MFVDVHAHLDDSKVNAESVVQKAKDAGVVSIVSNGISVPSNRKVLELAGKFDIVKPALGIYPLECLKLSEEAFANELEFIRKSKPIAIGEIGLDLHWDKDEKHYSVQKKCFEQFFDVAEKLKVPLIVHSRAAEADTIEMLSSTKAKVIMHCFGGGKKLVNKVIDNNWSFSIPVSVVYDEHFQRIIQMSELRNILTETDMPYLGPVKGEQNDSSNIPLSVTKIAQLRDITKEEAKKIIYMNYQAMFR